MQGLYRCFICDLDSEGCVLLSEKAQAVYICLACRRRLILLDMDDEQAPSSVVKEHVGMKTYAPAAVQAEAREVLAVCAKSVHTQEPDEIGLWYVHWDKGHQSWTVFGTARAPKNFRLSMVDVRKTDVIGPFESADDAEAIAKELNL